MEELLLVMAGFVGGNRSPCLDGWTCESESRIRSSPGLCGGCCPSQVQLFLRQIIVGQLVFFFPSRVHPLATNSKSGSH